MSVSILGTARGSLNSSTSDLTFAISPTGTNRAVLVCLTIENSSGTGSPSASATCGGVSMTKIAETILTGKSSSWFILTGVATGSQNIVCHSSENVNSYKYASAAYIGDIDQTTPVDAQSAVTSNNSTSQSVSVTTITRGSLVLGMFASLNGSTFATATSPNVVREQFPTDGYCGILDHGSVTLDPGSVTVSWTFPASRDPLRIAVALRDVSPPPPPGPSVSTDAADEITTTTAKLHGTIDDPGSVDCDLRGFVYGTTSEADPGDTAPEDSDYSNYTSESGTFGVSNFYAVVSSLSPDTRYYFRAWAHNDDGYSYGDETYFDTDALIYGIGGKVTLNGVGVSGATVRIIRQSDNEALTPETTDGSGDYEFLGLEEAELYHLAVEYEADDLKYQTVSYWDISPEVTN